MFNCCIMNVNLHKKRIDLDGEEKILAESTNKMLLYFL